MSGETTHYCTAEIFLKYKEIAIRAARTECACVTNISTNETWTRVKIHGVPLEAYTEKESYSTGRLREELMAENTGLEIPMAMRWLGNLAHIKKRYCKDVGLFEDSHHRSSLAQKYEDTSDRR